MANRMYSQDTYTMEKGTVTLWARVAIGAAGAPTLQQWNRGGSGGGTFGAAVTGGAQGIKSITRTSAGLYVLTLQDPYQRLLNYSFNFIAPTTGTAVAPTVSVRATGTDVTSATAPQITFTTQSSPGTPADPASGEVMLVTLELSNSSAL